MTSEYKEAEEPPPPPPERPPTDVDDGWGEDPQRRPRRRMEAPMQELNDQAPYEATASSTDDQPRTDVHDGWGEDPRRRESRRTADIAQHGDASPISESPPPGPLTPETTEPKAGSEEDEPRRDRTGRKGPEFSPELRHKPKVDSNVDDQQWAEDEDVELPHDEPESEPWADRPVASSSEHTSEDGVNPRRVDRVSAAHGEVDAAPLDRAPEGDTSRIAGLDRRARETTARTEVAAALAERPDQPALADLLEDANVREAERERLRTLSLEDAQPLHDSDHVSQVFVIECGPDLAFLKPAAGETEIHVDVPKGEQVQRSVATAEIDRALGFDLVPPTVARHDSEYGDASLQTNAPFDAKTLAAYSDVDRQMMGTLDYITGQLDRHEDNYRTQDDGRPAAIDNGFTFPEGEHDRLRSVFFPDVMGRDLAPQVLAAARSIDVDRASEQLRSAGISDAAIAGFRARLAEAQSGRITCASYAGGYRPQ